MLKLNLVALVIVFLILIGIVFLKARSNSSVEINNGLKKGSILTDKEAEKIGTFPEENRDSLKTHKISPLEIVILEKLSTKSEKLGFQEQKKNLIENQKETLKNNSFTTAEEVMDKLFPNFKAHFGEEKYEEMITSFPYGSIKDISGGLTSEQENKYKELLLERKVDAEMQIIDYKYTTEEIFKIINKLNRIYIPKFINILSEKQQKEFVKLVKEIHEF